MITIENGYINPHESEFDPIESNKFDYSVPFYDCQYFGIIAHWEGQKLIFDKVELFDGRNKVIHNFDVDYWEDLINPKFVEKIYREAYNDYEYLQE